MDLSKNGRLLCDLRKAKGMTQKQVADRLGIVPKTVSKWETGHGFPDVSMVSALADVLGVSEKILLTGDFIQNTEEVGNMKRTKFYVCPHCGSILQGTGNSQIICCGKQIEALRAASADAEHTAEISEIENDFYIRFSHEMTKEHYISFVAYVTYDRVLTVRLYPEQDSSVRFPKLYGGKFYFYCNRHGLFEYHPEKRRKKQEKPQTSLTSLMSAFSRAYHLENSENPVFGDSVARKLFSDEEYRQLQGYISAGGGDVAAYVNTQLAPTPLARAKFCEESLKTAVRAGTEQYVILGSGLDTFALRNENSAICIFEIDKKTTLEDKRNRLSRANLEIPGNTRLVAADLSKDRMKTVLEENGFDSGKKTFFSCLGLLYYLSVNEISALFEEISSFAADGSTVVFDFADNHLFSSDVPRVKMMVEMARQSGEPMKSCFGYGELELLLEKHHFLIYEFLNEEEIQKRYFANRDDGLTAFPHIHYALAVLKK